MSEEAKQVLTTGRFNSLWFIFIMFYLAVCSLSSLYVISFKNSTQAKIQRVKMTQVRKLMQEKKLKGFAENKNVDFEEIEYSQSGTINPNLRKKASAQASGETGDVREYQRQLAEYRLQVAQERRKILEEKRKQEEYNAKQLALIEQEKQERLRQQQELKKSQSVVQAVEGVSAPRTFTEPTPNTSSAQKSSVSVKPQTQQKTQIGTLKTSKLGESSFQNQRF